VLVSGGSRGIGRAIAQSFAERGARVIITGREAGTLEKAAAEISSAAAASPVGKSTDEKSSVPPPVAHVVCDVADSDAIRRAVQSVLEQYGRIDTLVNVAGVNRRKPALDITDDDYDFVVDINLRGAFVMSREVGRHMVERGSGSQINIASLNTDRPLKYVLPYAVSKAALGHMTRSLALEWGPQGVRVNALAPGFILTDLTRKLWSDEGMQAWGRTNTPQQRLGVPEDLVGTAIFLAAPASAFLTGQIIYVDGGFTAGWNWPMPGEQS
jgi:NAD(P)-dependent dehydrogenase (short-subunit alcohol dehydrogenase family)